MATLSFTSISIVTNFITSRQHPGTTLTMQLITMIVAVALLSTSALASPEKMEKRGPEGRYHIQRQAENESSPSTTIAIVSSSTTVEIVLATEPAAYTTGCRAVIRRLMDPPS